MSVSPVVWIVIAIVVVGAVVAIFGWDRYRGQKPSGATQPTSEVFADPATGKTMRVWYDPATGEREYRPE